MLLTQSAEKKPLAQLPPLGSWLLDIQYKNKPNNWTQRAVALGPGQIAPLIPLHF